MLVKARNRPNCCESRKACLPRCLVGAPMLPPPRWTALTSCAMPHFPSTPVIDEHVVPVAASTGGAQLPSKGKEIEALSFASDGYVPTESASLTRIMYSSIQSRAALSTATSGRHTARGPIPSGLSSILLLGFTVGTACLAALRARLKAVRECKACRGYGVQRCRLCNGKGTIDWEGKMSHIEPCPLCLGRRLVRCDACGGSPFIARGLFSHRCNKGEAALVGQLQNLAVTGRERPRWIQALMLRRGSRNEDEDRIEQSAELAQQIMMD